MHRFLIVMIGVMFVGCSGGTPQGENQPPAAVATQTAAPGASLAEWSIADIERDGLRMGYGKKKGEGILRREQTGEVLFVPETAEDHIATPFVPVAKRSGGRNIELLVAANTPGRDCEANLQDQKFAVLTTVPCNEAGEQRKVVAAPEDVTELRVYFQSGSLRPVRLPDRIRLVEKN